MSDAPVQATASVQSKADHSPQAAGAQPQSQRWPVSPGRGGECLCEPKAHLRAGNLGTAGTRTRRKAPLPARPASHPQSRRTQHKGMVPCGSHYYHMNQRGIYLCTCVASLK